MNDWQGSAEFSEEVPPQFRWRLDRWWGDGPRALLCMANPSYAGGDKNDPTITQVIKLFKALGYRGVTVVNWSPYIATDPKDLKAWLWNQHQEVKPAQVENIANIRALSIRAAVRVVAWGNIPPHSRQIQDALSLDGKYPLYAFAKTKSGSPTHPLARGKARLTIGAPLVVWRRAAVESEPA